MYFDNAGGDHVEAALAAMRPHGRIEVSGAVSRYNAETAPPAPRNLCLIVVIGIAICGFRATGAPDDVPVFFRTVGRYRRDGGLKALTVVEGIDGRCVHGHAARREHREDAGQARLVVAGAVVVRQ